MEFTVQISYEPDILEELRFLILGTRVISIRVQKAKNG